MPALPQIALSLDASRGVCRSLMQGVVRYARAYGPWQFLTVEGDVENALPRLKRQGAWAVIAQVDGDAAETAIRRAQLPAVVYRTGTCASSPASRNVARCEISIDYGAAGILAAEHLLERGFTDFAFFGESSRDWPAAPDAAQSFERRLGEAGRSVRVYSPRGRKRDAGANLSLENVAEWLQALPRPSGLFAANVPSGLRVLEACRAADLAPAIDVGVVAIEDDELLCELADPPLSSVALDAEACGYRAAEILDGMLGGNVGLQRASVGATRVVERASTQMLAIDDRQVAEAVQFIHCHAGQPIGVGDIVEGSSISRRSLEVRFRKALGCGPHDELQRVRLVRAQRLLVETDLSIPKVAVAAGYSSASYLAQVFQRRLGSSPAQFRRAYRSDRRPQASVAP
jgi:LacI family transcriptional regulator